MWLAITWSNYFHFPDAKSSLHKNIYPRLSSQLSMGFKWRLDPILTYWVIISQRVLEAQVGKVVINSYLQMGRNILLMGVKINKPVLKNNFQSISRGRVRQILLQATSGNKLLGNNSKYYRVKKSHKKLKLRILINLNNGKCKEIECIKIDTKFYIYYNIKKISLVG